MVRPKFILEPNQIGFQFFFGDEAQQLFLLTRPTNAPTNHNRRTCHRWWCRRSPASLPPTFSSFSCFFFLCARPFLLPLLHKKTLKLTLWPPLTTLISLEPLLRQPWPRPPPQHHCREDVSPLKLRPVVDDIFSSSCGFSVLLFLFCTWVDEWRTTSDSLYDCVETELRGLFYVVFTARSMVKVLMGYEWGRRMESVVWNVKNEAWAVNVMKGNGDGGSHEQAGMRKKKKMVMVIMSWWRIILFLFKIIEYGVSWLRKLSEIPNGH